MALIACAQAAPTADSAIRWGGPLIPGAGWSAGPSARGAGRDSPRRAAEDLAPRVVILANRDDPESLRIARHYAAARSVPPGNIVALPLPTAETITWREFVARLWDPLMAELVRERWIDAIAMNLVDPVGRRKYAVSGHRIAALVVCRGVPLRIAHDDALYAPVLPFTTRGEFRTNAGAVDGELSLLASPNYPINAFVPNPLFQNPRPTEFERWQVVEVSRLDGPTAADAMALVDRAIAAERDGLLGRAYVDVGDRDPIGNGWLEATAAQIADLGFDLSVDRAAGTMPADARIDAPVLYFGWYAPHLDGPFALPGFRFPPGAVVLHIHSYSATTLRSRQTGWAGPLVARGVTATVGNVYEPYLQLTHRPNLLLRALARGMNLADAAYYALQGLSWQEVLVGDPLYRPFTVTLDQQLRDVARLPPRIAGYAALRRMHQLDAAGRKDEATALLRDVQRVRPSLAVAYALAQRLHDAGDPDGAAESLGFALRTTGFAPDEWALARDVAHRFAAWDRPASAVGVWRVLLAAKTLPATVRGPWLREAAAHAAAANERAQADEWQREAAAIAAAG